MPDQVLHVADEVVNIDLTADELITRLKDGKIYDKTKVVTALANFFQPEKILQLRELALREVATAVERTDWVDRLLPEPTFGGFAGDSLVAASNYSVDLKFI